VLFLSIQPGWSFPLIFSFEEWQLPVHQVTDVLAYFLGFRLYLFLKKSSTAPFVPVEKTVWLFVGCIFGALIGAKILAWAEDPLLYWDLRHDPRFWTGGKTIVGGLLGGWIGIESAKKFLAISHSTGDLYVFPLILGMSLGRVGCFLTGLSDHTCGLPTRLPWGVDFGDGIPCHPAQIYEILFLILLGAILWMHRSSMKNNGALFRWFMGAYMGFRLCVEFIKPRETVLLGLSPIQWVCLIAIFVCWRSQSKLVA
jgi:phosphatidylglycerol---prolipoprotein diacylglyceryl transferase